MKDTISCYLDDYLAKNQHNILEKIEKHFSTCKHYYNHDHILQTILLFIVATSTRCGWQTKILNEA